MKEKNYNILNVLLTLSGVLFSGYLSSVKLLTSTCAFDEPCPLFLGYPACYFGFALFVVMFIASVLAVAQRLQTRTTRYALRIVSLGGILFAGYFVAQEVIRYRSAGFESGALVLPTCAYGLVFFVIIFAISFKTTRGPNIV